MIRLVHGDGTICEHRHQMLTFGISTPPVLELDPSAPPGARVCPDAQFAVARHGDGPPYIAWRRDPAPAGTIRPFGLHGAEIIHRPFDAGAARALLAVQTSEERIAAVSAYIQARYVSSPPWAPAGNWYVRDEFYREREGRWTSEIDPQTWRDTVMNQAPPEAPPLRFECVHQASNFRPCPEGCHAWPTS